MRRFYLFIKFCFYSTVFLILLGVGGLYYLFHSFSMDLPKLDSLKDYNPAVVSEVFAEDGTKVGEFWTEKRILLAPGEIPKLMEQAMISSEDSSFFDHSGIDYFGIVRAMLENIKAGHIVQGGSTITQQVVKSLLLTRERTWQRKIKEAILAKRLEEKFSKGEILYLYLNQIYLGNRSYGVAAAADNYFHKSINELNIAEAAMIAGLAKAPGTYSPIRDYNHAKLRQEYVIDRMESEGYISEDQAKQAKAATLKIFEAPIDKDYNARYAPWFVEEVRRLIIEKYGENVPYTHGLKIYTTLDLNAQKFAHNAVVQGLAELHKRHGYNGPLKHLNPSEFAAFNETIHHQMFRDSLEPGLVTPNVTPEQIKAAKVEISKDKLYQGLVTNLDKQARTITVQVGQFSGIILPGDFGWARKHNNDASGFNGVMYVQNPEKVVSVGDVIEVKVVDTLKFAQKNAKSSYKPDQLYFSLEETPQIEGALISYDPHTGQVKTVIGGKNFTASEFNRATQALRQTGSAFKPLLYAAALDKGYRPNTIINDEPIRIPDGPGRYWTPKNYGGGYKGPTSFHSALVFSRNVVSVRIILDVGVDYVTGLLRKLGIDTPIAKVYSMALGANDMKLAELARAFGIFPTGGILPEYIWITKMTDRFGTVLEKNDPAKIKTFAEQIAEGSFTRMALVSDANDNTENLRKDLWTHAQTWIKKDKLMLTPFENILLYGRHIPEGYVMNPKTMAIMVGIMQDIVNMGTGTKVKPLGRPVAGKTGTTNDQTDCWFVGYTPDLLTGVWTGYDQNRIKVGAGETGGKAAAPIFLYFMQEYLKDKPIAQFDLPRDMGSQYAELDPPVDVSPSDVSKLFTSGNASGGADFFVDDL